MFTFHLYARDEGFDYRHGELPAPLLCRFGDQLDRARAVLAHRSDAQLDYLRDSLAWILKEGNQHLFKETTAALEHRSSVPVSRVKALDAYLRSTDLRGQTEIPDATPADYFAALTLAYVGEALYSLQEKPRRPTERDRLYAQLEQELAYHHEQALIDMAIEAMDAVGMAERDAAERRATDQAVEATSARHGQLGGKLRAARYSELRQMLKTAYLKQHTHRSTRNAAKRLCEEFAQQVDSTLNTEDPQKQLEKWIAQYRHEEGLSPTSHARKAATPAPTTRAKKTTGR